MKNMIRESDRESRCLRRCSEGGMVGENCLSTAPKLCMRHILEKDTLYIRYASNRERERERGLAHAV